MNGAASVLLLFAPSDTHIHVHGCMQVSLEAKGSESFQTARGACVPFGVMDLALDELPGNQQQRYKALLAASESAPLQEINAIADELQVLLLM